MTFTIVARCPRSGQFGAAVSSSSPAVASRCIRVRSGVGAVASQNVTDPALGPLLLDRLAAGDDAARAIEAVSASAPHAAYRQLLAVDATGTSAIFSGANALGIVAEARDVDVACGGNLLASPEVPSRMVAAFQQSDGPLADRLVIAMRAGRDAGGEMGPIHSAGMLVVDRYSWPVVDLRVDWSEEDPIVALEALWQRYRPQMAGYIQRAVDPSGAPAYGVPGER